MQSPLPAPHPEIQALRRECATLELKLAELLEKLAELRTHARASLETLYDKNFGRLECRLLRLQTSNAARQRRNELLVERLNRGEPVDAAALAVAEAVVAAELAAWWAEVEHCEREVRRNLDRLGQPELSAPEVRKLKSTYRRLARLLHPDLAGAQLPESRRFWEETQRAYSNGDLPHLEAVLALVERNAPVPPERDSLAELRRDRERLAALVREQERRLADLRTEAPFRYELLLRDPEWTRTKVSGLRSSIRRENRRARLLDHTLRELLSCSAPRAAGGEGGGTETRP